MEQHDQPCSAEQRERIIREAVFRLNFVRWLAGRLRRDECPWLIRNEAALALEQLTS